MDAVQTQPCNAPETIAVIPSSTTRTTRNTHTTDITGSCHDADPTHQQTLPGLTPERGLSLWQNPADYRRYLRQFARQYADGATRIDLGDPPGASQFARTLKGIAGTLGLPEVAAAARRLELALDAEPPAEIATITEAQEALQTALAIAFYSIARYAPESSATPAVNGNRPHDQLFAGFDGPLDADPAASASSPQRLAHDFVVPLED